MEFQPLPKTKVLFALSVWSCDVTEGPIHTNPGTDCNRTFFENCTWKQKKSQNCDRLPGIGLGGFTSPRKPENKTQLPRPSFRINYSVVKVNNLLQTWSTCRKPSSGGIYIPSWIVLLELLPTLDCSGCYDLRLHYKSLKKNLVFLSPVTNSCYLLPHQVTSKLTLIAVRGRQHSNNKTTTNTLAQVAPTAGISAQCSVQHYQTPSRAAKGMCITLSNKAKCGAFGEITQHLRQSDCFLPLTNFTGKINTIKQGRNY